MRFFVITIFLLAFAINLSAQWLKPSEQRLRKHIYELASERYAGRESQTAGDTLSVRYIQKYLSGIKGVEMLFDDGSQSFTVQSMDGKVSTFNVAAMIEGSDSLLKNEVVIIGAHYDHVGQQIDDSTTITSYGADDNASGVAFVLELARDIASKRKEIKRSVVFVLFGGEEKGLLGSKYFAENIALGEKKPLFMVNFDMMGRLIFERGLDIIGTKTSVSGDSLVRSVEIPLDGQLKINYIAEASAASDHLSFLNAGIPIICFNTGIHSDYHKPSDTPQKINFLGMNILYGYTSEIIKEILTAPKAELEIAR